MGDLQDDSVITFGGIYWWWAPDEMPWEVEWDEEEDLTHPRPAAILSIPKKKRRKRKR